MNRKPKLRTFSQIHDFDHFQSLVSSNISRYQRSLVAQLKFGILPLKIETDRYQGIPLEQRICKLCDSNSIETELHFLFHCNALSDARKYALNNLELEYDINEDGTQQIKTFIFQTS